ncbi:MAG: hypothetical protein ACRC6D_05895, partial [Aeromonas sp.]
GEGFSPAWCASHVQLPDDFEKVRHFGRLMADSQGEHANSGHTPSKQRVKQRVQQREKQRVKQRVQPRDKQRAKHVIRNVVKKAHPNKDEPLGRTYAPI